MKISIIGAGGNVGSAAAFNIAIHNITDELVMIDDYSPDRLAQYVFDLNSSVTGMDTAVRRGSYADMRDSDIVLIAAGSANAVSSPRELLRPNLPLLRDLADKIKSYCPKSIVITATNPIDPLNYAMTLFTGFDRKRILGYSANDSIRFRMYLAQTMGIKSSRVTGTVMGEHGSSQVLLFSSVKVDGKPFVVSPEIRQAVFQEVAKITPTLEALRIKTGRTSSWATSMGLTDICRAISLDTGEMIPCSIVLDGEYGYRGVSISVPTLIGREGVTKILEWKLTPDEQEGLSLSIYTLKPAMKYVDEFIGGK